MSKKPRDPTNMCENLERIADALDQPVSVFYNAEGKITREVETLELIIAFDRITGSQVRAKCIAVVKAEAAWEEHD